ncbi:MAG: hypothetical protein DRJ47_06025 [Thermoprotei archaeon]|nr:MAG: hypothetical protein DRJ47_06025 [Thermoprotei archaeon]
MIDISELKRCFPFDSYRKYQEKVLEKIANHYNNGKRLVLLNAAVGFGKSPILVAFCRYFGDSLYVTPQIILQEQLMRDFPDLAIIKGMNNYYCADSGYSRTCDVGTCKLKKGYECEYREHGECEYYRAKEKAKSSPVALLNFAYFISEGLSAYSVFSDRKFIVIDEAHNIDNVVLDHVSVNITKRSVGRTVYNDVIGDNGSIRKELIEFVFEDVRDALYDRRNFLKSKDVLHEEESKELSKIERMIQKIDAMEIDVNKGNEWLVKFNKDISVGPIGIICKPLYAKGHMNEFVFDKADLFLFASATFINPHIYLSEIGAFENFDKSEVVMINVPSIFPVKNRQIIDYSVGKLTNDQIHKNLPKALSALIQILNAHEDDKGIIHCHSYKIARAVMNLKGDVAERLMGHESDTRVSSFEEWVNSDGNKVFVSVNMTEGLDLKDDLARFQVIMKAPFQPPTDDRVQRRLELKHWNWYFTEAMKVLAQAYGRIVRSEDDYGVTYVLDTSAAQLYRRKGMPEWIREAVSDKQYKYMTKKEIKRLYKQLKVGLRRVEDLTEGEKNTLLLHYPFLKYEQSVLEV